MATPCLDTASCQEPRLEGWLIKRTHPLKVWRARWISLWCEGPKQVFEASTELRGAPLSESHPLESISDCKSTDEDFAGRPHCFVLEVFNIFEGSAGSDADPKGRIVRKRVVVLQATDDEARDKWVEFVVGALQPVKVLTLQACISIEGELAILAINLAGQTVADLKLPRGITMGRLRLELHACLLGLRLDWDCDWIHQAPPADVIEAAVGTTLQVPPAARLRFLVGDGSAISEAAETELAETCLIPCAASPRLHEKACNGPVSDGTDDGQAGPCASSKPTSLD